MGITRGGSVQRRANNSRSAHVRRMKNNYFSTVAGAYACYRPHYPQELYEFLAGCCRHVRRAWDCATGNGQAAVALAAHFDFVVATDLSQQQLAHAAASDRVGYAVSSAEQAPLGTAAVDLVSVAQALHWFDLPVFYRAVDRVLAEDGVLAVWCYQLLRTNAEVDAVIDRLYHEVVGPFWPPQRKMVEQGYATLAFPYPERSCPPFAMKYEWSLQQLLGYMGSWSACQRYREANRKDPVALIAGALGEAWGDPAATRIVRWPLAVRVGKKPSMRGSR